MYSTTPICDMYLHLVFENIYATLFKECLINFNEIVTYDSAVRHFEEHIIYCYEVLSGRIITKVYSMGANYTFFYIRIYSQKHYVGTCHRWALCNTYAKIYLEIKLRR